MKHCGVLKRGHTVRGMVSDFARPHNTTYLSHGVTVWHSVCEVVSFQLHAPQLASQRLSWTSIRLLSARTNAACIPRLV